MSAMLIPLSYKGPIPVPSLTLSAMLTLPPPHIILHSHAMRMTDHGG